MEIVGLVVLWRIIFSIHEGCAYHPDTFWLSKLLPYFKPNWKNKYVTNRMGELVVDKSKYRVKWWAWVIPFDGVHWLKTLMVFIVLNIAYLGIDVQLNYFYFIPGMLLILMLIHLFIFRQDKI